MNEMTIPLTTLKEWRACQHDYRVVARLFPDGVPLTMDAYHTLRSESVDVLWGAVRLLDRAGRVEFLLFTLRQRQPHLVAMLRRAGLDDHADNVASLRFDTAAQAGQAWGILDTARNAASEVAREAASDAAWDAARAAAWAAREAASEAARDAARAAARDAARDAARAAQIRWILRRIGALTDGE